MKYKKQLKKGNLSKNKKQSENKKTSQDKKRKLSTRLSNTTKQIHIKMDK